MPPSEQNLYNAEARSRHGTGRVEISGAEALPVSAPSELGGSEGGYDPEQLYAAALAACLHQALVIAASEVGADPSGSEVTTRVRLNSGEPQRYTFDATADVTLPSAPDQRDRVLSQALRICPVGDQLAR